MNRAVALSVLAVLAPAALAQVPDTVQAPDTSKVQWEPTPETEAAEAVALAASLAAYGRRAGSAHALAASAALLIENPVPLGRFDDQEPDDEVAPGRSLDPDVLLDEARMLAPDGGPLEDEIDSLRARVPPEFPPVRGAERGPIRYASAAEGEAIRGHAITFRGRETATFHLVGDGVSDLDYYLYNVDGELVASGDGPASSATLIWYVPYRQRLTLRVRNHGERPSTYHVITN